MKANHDKCLKFDKHIENICQKASRKLNALARLVDYMDLPKRPILMDAFFNAQFNYCPTIWMFHNRSLNNKINTLHERCLKTIYNDKQSNFEELLVRDNSVPIHYQNFQCLAVQMYMVANGMSPDIMSEIFQLRENMHYHLRHKLQFIAHPIHNVFNGSESAIEPLEGFKEKIKK